MFILTDGKFFVMENPLKQGEYLRNTNEENAKEFTYKQAKSLTTRPRGKRNSWIKGFQIVNKATGKVEEINKSYVGNAGVFCNDKELDFDESVLENIGKEINSILGLAAWDVNQLNSFKSVLIQGQQYYDCILSDIRHARMDKHPPAHIMTKIDKMVNEMWEKRRDIKQSIVYVDTLIDGIEQAWSLGKIKAELSKVKYVPYRGRTKYFDIVEEMLKDY